MIDGREKIPELDAVAMSKPVSDTSLRGLFGYTLKRTFSAIQADLALTLRPYELRMLTYSLLAIIVDNPGLRQSQLAQVLAIERPNLVVLLDELEQRDLITREREVADRRAYALTCSLAGRHLFEQARAAVLAHEERYLQALNAGEADEIMARLRQVERKVKGNS